MENVLGKHVIYTWQRKKEMKIVFPAVLFSISVCLTFRGLHFFQFISNFKSIQLFFRFSCLWLKWEWETKTIFFLSRYFFLHFYKLTRGQVSQKIFYLLSRFLSYENSKTVNTFCSLLWMKYYERILSWVTNCTSVPESSWVCWTFHSTERADKGKKQKPFQKMRNNVITSINIWSNLKKVSEKLFNWKYT